MHDDEGDRETWSSVRLPRRLRLKLGQIAERENRTVAAQIRQFIDEGVARREREEAAS